MSEKVYGMDRQELTEAVMGGTGLIAMLIWFIAGRLFGPMIEYTIAGIAMGAWGVVIYYLLSKYHEGDLWDMNGD